MLKKEFIETIMTIVEMYDFVYKGDKPAIRQLFNDKKDMYHKAGVLTESQCQNWILTDKELNKLMKIN